MTFPLHLHSINILKRLLTVIIIMKNYLTPKIQKINMQPHSSNSIENVTPLLSQPSRKNRPHLAAHLH